jgi:hypothetical protein
MTTEELNPFHGCDVDEVMALVFDMEGPDGLRAVLAHVDLDRECLTAAANKLDQAGLIDGAKIVREAAMKADTRSSREIAIVLREADPIRQKADFARLYRQGGVTISTISAVQR